MIDRRLTCRRHLYKYFEVIDQDSLLLVGHLENISCTGLKILKGILSIPKQFMQLIILLPREIRQRGILVDAKLVWCRQNNDNTFDAGFEFCNMPENTIQNIKDIF